ncbi:magnesium/cobalt transporter CorA [Penaeicola halotolerans]|uniref:magnesium/cobalt transporter CorA n=1 Tax=Penaeicola halotolerans TaxID=2793196 RepID=UPI001CF83607|nr:magnesium/cobalt transporter CorA [Penaeicola halotolerans]
MGKRRKHKSSIKKGLAPGTLVHVGEKNMEQIELDLYCYNADELSFHNLQSVEELDPFMTRKGVKWLNISGVHDVDIISAIGKKFNLHPLVMEDLVSTQQRPKLEIFDHYLFIVNRMLYTLNGHQEFVSEQVSFIVGDDYILSFQEKKDDVFDGVRKRLENAIGRMRKSGPDYMLYALMDSIVDHYFILLEHVSDSTEEIENDVFDDKSPRNVLSKIHAIKYELINMRKAVWPLREVLANIKRLESPLVQEETKIFINDVYDHTIQIIDGIETQRDITGSLVESHMTNLSNKQNDVMKTLTIISTIFIPLTFIAGVYGMNFEYIPELSWSYGYFGVWAVFLILATVLFIYFKVKKWF